MTATAPAVPEDEADGERAATPLASPDAIDATQTDSDAEVPAPAPAPNGATPTAEDASVAAAAKPADAQTDAAPAPEPLLGNGQPVREAPATRATAPASDYIKRFSPQAPPEAAEVADAAAAPQEAATRDHP